MPFVRPRRLVSTAAVASRATGLAAATRAKSRIRDAVSAKRVGAGQWWKLVAAEGRVAGVALTDLSPRSQGSRSPAGPGRGRAEVGGSGPIRAECVSSDLSPHARAAGYDRSRAYDRLAWLRTDLTCSTRSHSPRADESGGAPGEVSPVPSQAGQGGFASARGGGPGHPDQRRGALGCVRGPALAPRPRPRRLVPGRRRRADRRADLPPRRDGSDHPAGAGRLRRRVCRRSGGGLAAEARRAPRRRRRARAPRPHRHRAADRRARGRRPHVAVRRDQLDGEQRRRRGPGLAHGRRRRRCRRDRRR